jgi:hypothetical protein
MEKGRKNGAGSGELKKAGVTWQVAAPGSTESNSTGPAASSSSLAQKASIKRSASSLVSSLISSLGSNSPSTTRTDSVSGGSSPCATPKGSGSSFSAATSAAAISNAAGRPGSPSASTLSMVGSYNRQAEGGSPFSWSGGSVSCNAVMTSGIGLGSLTDPGEWAAQ